MSVPVRHRHPRAGLGRTWLAGLLRHRTLALLAMAVGVALAVALLASLGTFLSSSKAQMTSRAVSTVAVDWQVEVQRGADATRVAQTVAADPHVTTTALVQAATTSGLEHTSKATTQTTGPGQVLGLPGDYARLFPGEIRLLAGTGWTGDGAGALLFQQTAANLGARPGDTISIGRAGLSPATVRVAGIVDLPQADSLFQQVGAPPGTGLQAPPDNVVLLPDAGWHTVFDPLATSRPDQVRTQVHATTEHAGLPPDPVAAYTEVTGQARHLEVQLAGSGLVGDNLGAALGAARSDALYAQVLFLFLGAPGAVVAGILTAKIAGASRARRRREQALLRARGATAGQLSALGVAEALLIGLVGSATGLLLALLAGRWVLGTAASEAITPDSLLWDGVAMATALVITAGSIALPAHLDARRTTVTTARLTIGRTPARPWWMRWWIDVALLVLAAVVFWSTTRTGYELVLAVEGVPAISVSYWAFAGPALLWAGGALLCYRLVDLLLGRGRPLVATVLRRPCGALADVIAATLQRERRGIALGSAIVAVTIAFAASTAVFDTTYQQQAEADAVLTNGADVTVTTSPGEMMSAASPVARELAAVPGVRAVEPIEHRFAYVGSDLQDLYGVRPSTILGAGHLQDAYFQGGTAQGLIGQLRTKPDNILVSAETVKDFQLLPGDLLRLRLQNGVTKEFVEVPFHYAGVVKEFPTAPSDSFLLANADYVAKATGSDAVGAFLLDTGGTDVAPVAHDVRALVGSTAAVTDIVSSRHIIGSSLTAVDLLGLTRLELAFALALAVAATGLSLWLGLHERRRMYAIAAALGARARQLGGFIVAEAAAVALTGLALGGLLAATVAEMLVNVLHGVFDPPPEAPAVPVAYLLAVLALAVASAAGAAVLTVRAARVRDPQLLRTRD